MEDIGMASMKGVTSLVHSPYLYPGKSYQPLFPRTNCYQFQTVQPEAGCPPSSGCWETLLCFHCKHKTTVTYDVKLLLATHHTVGNSGCFVSGLRGTQEHQEAFLQLVFFLLLELAHEKLKAVHQVFKSNPETCFSLQMLDSLYTDTIKKILLVSPSM